MIHLLEDADYSEMPDLAEELYRRLQQYRSEYMASGTDLATQAYLNGLVSAYGSVLSAIGFEEGNN